MLPKTEHEIYKNVNSYAKIYPSITKLFLFPETVKVRMSGFEEIKPKLKIKKPNNNPITLLDSLRRTKTRLSDIILSNDFDLFCTFTFKKDRQNVDLLKKRMSKWLNNQQNRVGKFDYLIVPEFHKDGLSIHFHALFNGYKGTLVDSGKKRSDGRVVYNIQGYTHGFSTATKIDQTGGPKVASYVKKYITKDMPQFSGKKRYWCSHELTRPKKVQNPYISEKDHQKFEEEYLTKDNITVKIAPERLDLHEQIYPEIYSDQDISRD